MCDVSWIQSIQMEIFMLDGRFFLSLYLAFILNSRLFFTSTNVRVNLVRESNRNNVTEVIYSIRRPIDIKRHKLCMEWIDAP